VRVDGLAFPFKKTPPPSVIQEAYVIAALDACNGAEGSSTHEEADAAR
jgi:hypothetical protein